MLELARSFFFGIVLDNVSQAPQVASSQVRKAKTSREVFFDLILLFPRIPFAARLYCLEISAALSQREQVGTSSQILGFDGAHRRFESMDTKAILAD